VSSYEWHLDRVTSAIRDAFGIEGETVEDLAPPLRSLLESEGWTVTLPIGSMYSGSAEAILRRGGDEHYVDCESVGLALGIAALVLRGVDLRPLRK